MLSFTANISFGSKAWVPLPLESRKENMKETSQIKHRIFQKKKCLILV